ncbi:MAG: hypothetical protein Q8L48_16695 [Archangium sp.]|nr:hypothetical protein [Archangium sp.]
MSDPSLLPEGSGEALKTVGTAGGGGLLALLIGRIFRGQDKAENEVISKLNVLQASVSRLSENVAVLLSESKRASSDMAAMSSAIAELQQKVAALEAKHEAAVAE